MIYMKKKLYIRFVLSSDRVVSQPTKIIDAIVLLLFLLLKSPGSLNFLFFTKHNRPYKSLEIFDVRINQPINMPKYLFFLYWRCFVYGYSSGSVAPPQRFAPNRLRSFVHVEVATRESRCFWCISTNDHIHVRRVLVRAFEFSFVCFCIFFFFFFSQVLQLAQ